jgi:hypothetical protein
MALSTTVNGQTTKASTSDTVTFHDMPRSHVESVPEPAPALQQISAELSGILSGGSPNASIQFVLSVQNMGRQEAKIQDPLDIFSLQFSTAGDKLIHVPDRVAKALADIGLPKGTIPGARRDEPYPAPIRFRRIVRGTLASYEKEESITIPVGGKVQIEFESEPVVMERVTEALRTEPAQNAKSFKTRATISLVAAPLQPGMGARLMKTGWLFFNAAGPIMAMAFSRRRAAPIGRRSAAPLPHVYLSTSSMVVSPAKMLRRPSWRSVTMPSSTAFCLMDTVAARSLMSSRNGSVIFISS